MNDNELTSLVGKTITSIKGLNKDSEEIIFECSDGSKYKMYHEQDCCESVWLADIYGDKEDLIGTPILKAEINTNEDCPPLEGTEPYTSYTWTFYTLATVKGTVDLRWYGTSNGYYSESVDFIKIK